MNKLFLHGTSDTHITTLENTSLKKEVHLLLADLKKHALDKEIEIVAISSYRSFDQQKRIWNEKAQGNRDLLDNNCQKLDYACLSLEQIMHAILRWSALPGFSRHHWGTDFDVIDKKALDKSPEYQVQLIPSEYAEGGIFEKLGKFLSSSSALKKSGFFRPYKKDLGGVAPEPWHLSSIQYAKEQEELQNLQLFKTWLNSAEMADLRLLSTIKENAEDIFERYVINTQSNPMA